MRMRLYCPVHYKDPVSWFQLLSTTFFSELLFSMFFSDFYFYFLMKMCSNKEHLVHSSDSGYLISWWIDAELSLSSDFICSIPFIAVNTYPGNGAFFVVCLLQEQRRECPLIWTLMLEWMMPHLTQQVQFSIK